MTTLTRSGSFVTAQSFPCHSASRNGHASHFCAIQRKFAASCRCGALWRRRLLPGCRRGAAAKASSSQRRAALSARRAGCAAAGRELLVPRDATDLPEGLRQHGVRRANICRDATQVFPSRVRHGVLQPMVVVHAPEIPHPAPQLPQLTIPPPLTPQPQDPNPELLSSAPYEREAPNHPPQSNPSQRTPHPEPSPKIPFRQTPNDHPLTQSPPKQAVRKHVSFAAGVRGAFALRRRDVLHLPVHQPSRSDQIDRSQIADSHWQTPQSGLAVKVNLGSANGPSGPTVRVGGRRLTSHQSSRHTTLPHTRAFQLHGTTLDLLLLRCCSQA